MKVLIAEDSNVPRMVLQKAIRKLGHECIVTRDGAEAWEYLRENDVDVIVSDRMMPGLDGIELCRRVRERPTDAYAYFIFLTALEESRHLLEGMQAGADDYLTKPLDLGKLELRLIAASRVTALYRKLSEQRGELERLNDEFFHQARRDGLTQLGNRLRLWEDLEALRGRVERYGHTYSIAICDVDHFKLYNDTYGHQEGDAALREVARVIQAQARSGDSAYRYGGEEFVLILPEQSLEGATIALERLRRAVELSAMPHRGLGDGAVVTLSAGVTALRSGDTKSIDEVLREADAALYDAKREGRNRVAVYACGSAEQGAPRAVGVR